MDNYMIMARERQAMLDAAKAAFLLDGGEVQEVEGFKPSLRIRTDWVDPDTVLKRKKPALTRAERKMLQGLANELEAGK